MARLEAVDGDWLELTPIGFEFEKGDPSNWLRLELFYEFGDARRRPTIDSAFTMSETRSLVSWLRRASEGELAIGSLFMGIEPNLQITLNAYQGRGVELAVEFEQEWAPRPHVPQPLAAVFTRNRLRRFADDLELQLQHLSDGNLHKLVRPEVWRRGSSHRPLR